MNARKVVAALLVALVAAPAAGGQDATAGLAVSVGEESISTQLGGKFSFRSTITNHGSTTASGLIAHLNVLSLRKGVYVDPEDWSSDRTRYLEDIPPGGSITTTWRMQAVNDGAFGIYVAVLDESGAARPPVTGPAIRLAVAERRTLNAGGILSVALTIPAGLGLLALGLRLRRGRSGREDRAETGAGRAEGGEA